MEENKVEESDIQVQLADLDLSSGTTAIPAKDSQRRSLRKRPPPSENRSSNRRVMMKPQKRQNQNLTGERAIEALYLSKKVNIKPNTLETIFEEAIPLEGSSTCTLIGGRKVKRTLKLQVGKHYTKEKIKKRRAKIKRLLGSKKFLHRKKVTMKAFLEKIASLEEADSDSKENGLMEE